MPAKLNIVEKCSDCSTYEKEGENHPDFWCTRLWKHVNPLKIHPDCPLPDAPDEVV